MKRTVKTPFIFVFLLGIALQVSAQKIDSTAQKAKTRNIDGTVMSSSKSILENLSASSEFTTLTSAIKVADLRDTLNNVTVFAPTNKAFEKLAPGKLDTLLLPAHKTELTSLLTYHVIAGMITSKDIYRQIKAGNGQAIFKTISGGSLTASLNKNRNILLTDENGGQSVISKFDILQNNGMLYIITDVLVPKSQ